LEAPGETEVNSYRIEFADGYVMTVRAFDEQDAQRRAETRYKVNVAITGTRRVGDV
jgi:hypothetical protein